MPLDLNRSKLRFHPDRVKAWLDGERIAPITVDLALTQRCNYDCEFCYAQLQQNSESRPWTWDMIKSTFDDFSEIGVKAVSLLSDGESTCNNLYRDAIRHAYRNGLDVALGTNGYYLDRESLERIMPNLTYLRFNITGASKKRYMEIHGVVDKAYFQVLENIREAVAVKRENCLRCTIGMQMVFTPKYIDQVIPLTYLAQGLGVDYLMIKHCSDDEKGSLGVPYGDYELCHEALKRAENVGNEEFQVIIKWDKIKAGDKREYSRCLAAPFQLQISGSGLVAPCGMFFHSKYFRYHIGSLHTTRFIEMFNSERYWDVMNYLGSGRFNAKIGCGILCLQDATNIYLNKLKAGSEGFALPGEPIPQHVNFI